MAQSPFQVTAAHLISLPDGSDAFPGQPVECDPRAAADLVALGHLTPASAAPPKTAPLPARDVAAEPAPDKE